MYIKNLKLTLNNKEIAFVHFTYGCRAALNKFINSCKLVEFSNIYSPSFDEIPFVLLYNLLLQCVYCVCIGLAKETTTDVALALVFKVW